MATCVSASAAEKLTVAITFLQPRWAKARKLSAMAVGVADSTESMVTPSSSRAFLTPSSAHFSNRLLPMVAAWTKAYPQSLPPAAELFDEVEGPPVVAVLHEVRRMSPRTGMNGRFMAEAFSRGR